MADVYQNWRDRLAGKDVPVHADRPDPGYYKVRDGRDGPWKPCAIWYPAGSNDLTCRVGSDARDPLVTWTYAAKNPISKDAAKFAFDNGYFPDEPKPRIGDNSRDLSLAEEIKDAAEQAADWLKGGIKTDTDCDLAANWRQRLLDLKKKAELEHKTEKQPHLDAGRVVDAKFKPLIDIAASAADAVRAVLTKYMAAKEARERAEAEAKWKAEQERVRVERERIEAERHTLMENDPIQALTSPQPEMPEMPAAPEPVKINAGGQRGRKTGLRTVKKVRVTDHAAALAFFSEAPEVRELVSKLATRLVLAGGTVPGADIYEEKVAA